MMGKREDGEGVGNVPDRVRRVCVFPSAPPPKKVVASRSSRTATFWGQKESRAASLWGDTSQHFYLPQKGSDDMGTTGAYPTLLKGKMSLSPKPMITSYNTKKERKEN